MSAGERLSVHLKSSMVGAYTLKDLADIANQAFCAETGS